MTTRTSTPLPQAVSSNQPFDQPTDQPTDKRFARGLLPAPTPVQFLDALAMLAVLNKAVAHARAGQGPVLVEAHTYRLDAHTNADDATRYRDSKEVEDWLRRDPIARLETWLRHERLVDDALVASVEDEAETFAASVRDRLSVDLVVDPMSLFDNVFGTPTPQLLEQRAMVQAELKTEAEVKSEESSR